MDWNDTPEQTAFRQRVKALIAEEFPDYYRRRLADGLEDPGSWIGDRNSDDEEQRQAAVAWGDAISKHGWFAPQWPTEYGGGGLSPMEQFIYNMELAKAAAPTVGGAGVSLLGRTLIVHGTDEQKASLLPKISFPVKTVWTQGYSEPGAGSDLASLQTRAVLRR